MRLRLTDPTNGLVFPDLNAPPFGGQDFQTNLIMPEPTIFLSRKFPPVSIIRPTETQGAAMGAVKALTADGLFIGQSKEFFAVLYRTGKASGRGATRSVSDERWWSYICISTFKTPFCWACVKAASPSSRV